MGANALRLGAEGMAATALVAFQFTNFRHGRPSRTPDLFRGGGELSATHEHLLSDCASPSNTVFMGPRDALRFATRHPGMTTF
jgi:hypothetical protein